MSQINSTLHANTPGDVKPAGLPCYLGKIEEARGDDVFTRTYRFQSDDPKAYLDRAASHFCNEDGGDEKGNGYEFEGGSIYVEAAGFLQIPTDVYLSLKDFIDFI